MDLAAVPTQRFARYVAIGDSSTEGLDDPDGRGGYRGWANRLAERLTAAQGSLLYANLAVRGRRTREIREQQLERALAMRPDLATIFSGTNDVVTRRFDLQAVAADLEAIQLALIDQGATVLTFTLPDLSPVMPFARPIAPRITALNQSLRAVCERTGAILVDFAFPACVAVGDDAYATLLSGKTPRSRHLHPGPTTWKPLPRCRARYRGLTQAGPGLAFRPCSGGFPGPREWRHPK
jgi:lysophospholipase L1-like esterase